MSNLEFRLWSKVAQQMISWDEIKESGKFFTIFGDSRYIPMQWTGLTDKNGTKSFRGDISRSFHYADASGKMFYLKHVIEWSEKYSVGVGKPEPPVHLF